MPLAQPLALGHAVLEANFSVLEEPVGGLAEVDHLAPVVGTVSAILLLSAEVSGGGFDDEVVPLLSVQDGVGYQSVVGVVTTNEVATLNLGARLVAVVGVSGEGSLGYALDEPSTTGQLTHQSGDHCLLGVVCQTWQVDDGEVVLVELFDVSH